MRILGIDQSYTSTGWVLAIDGKISEYGLIKSEKSEEKFSIFKRAMFVSDQLMELIDRLDPDVINIEGLAMGNMPGNRSRELAGLQFLIISKIIEKDPTMLVNIPAPTQIKKLATGNGRSKKPELFDHMPEAVQKEFMKYPKTKGRFDLTDAYWLARFYDDMTLEQAAKLERKK